ncbi:MAG: SDR family oxidoreductase [Clostridia bacterium]|nr:SDR family oxidoreductase [Clostridia bacterium]NCC76667.1 SDR family oxidoreductase [Clostridia bacterium]
MTPAYQPDFSGATVLITGGAAGIGRCLTLSFAQAGAQVILADRDQEAGEETLAILSEQGLQAHFIQTDLSDQAQIVQLAQQTRALAPSGLSILIHNAAIANAHSANLFSEDPAAFDQVLAVNLAAPFHLTRLLKESLVQAGGCVIDLASTRAYQSEPQSEGYAASKGGMVALTHAMAISLGEQGIRVNAIAPGWIDTTEWQKGRPGPAHWPDEEHRQHPAGRIGRPADIAAACFFLASPDAGFITGQTLVIDGGMSRKMIYR